MTWLDVVLAYITAAQAVIDAAPVWGPVLLGVAVLWCSYRITVRRRRRGQRPDTSGTCPGSGECPHPGETDRGALTCADTCPDVSGGPRPDVSGRDDEARS